MAEQPRQYWAFFANPRIYRIEEAVRELTTDLWTTKGRPVRTGDRVLIWKGAGVDRYRGIVALGEVLTDPDLRADSANRFWVTPPASDELEERVAVRYVVPHGLPILSDGASNAVLDQLSVSRARGGTVFNVSAEQWQHVLAAVGGWPASAPELEVIDALLDPARPRAASQGFEMNAAIRRLIELHAMSEATQLLEARGWRCEDVSSREPYDLRCTRPGHAGSLHVEVKGTTSDGSLVLLTPNEVEHARQCAPDVALFILSEVQLDNPSTDSPVVSGGVGRLLLPWQIGAGKLTVIGYSYSPLAE